MRIGLIYELVPVSELEPGTDDIFAEFEDMETIQMLALTLEGLGHTVVMVDSQQDLSSRLLELRNQIDLAFNYSVGFGCRSREILAPAICEALRIPFTGGDAMSLALASNKHVAKLLVKAKGIPTPNWLFVQTADDISLHNAAWLDSHVLLKPCFEGSSIGVTQLRRTQSWDALVEFVNKGLARYSHGCIVEQFISGFEVTVPVIEAPLPVALPPVALEIDGTILLGDRIFESRLKRDPALVRWSPEVPFGDELVSRLTEWSAQIHKSFGFKDYSRVDFRISESGEPYFLEANPVPGLTPHGGTFVTAAERIGMTYPDIVNAIVSSAYNRRQTFHSQNQSSQN